MRYTKLFASTLIPIREHTCRRCAVSSSSLFHLLTRKRVILQNNPASSNFLCRTLRFNARNREPSSSDTNHKILKVAVVGTPNAGKSTLINQIVGRNVFPVSSKVHTTRCRARAVMVIENTQLVFLDTPGVVDVQESIKHHLEHACLVDSEEATKEADIIGVIHDVSNKHTMFKLDPKILRHLLLYSTKPSFLVLNKVDAMKSKRDLLDCVNLLTSGNGVLEESKILHSDEGVRGQLKESDLQDLLIDCNGWPYFRKVFMISALKGDGVGDIQMYLMDEAKPGKWLFERGVITDQNDVNIIQQTVFSKLLDHLPNVVPYNVGIQLDYFDRNIDGSVTAVVILYVNKSKMVNFIKGKGGQRIRRIATDVEQSLRSFYLNDVHIRLVIAEKKNSAQLNEPQLAEASNISLQK